MVVRQSIAPSYVGVEPRDETVLIICSGGPAPGINTVLAATAKAFMSDGYRVIGLHKGTQNLFNPDIDEPATLVEFDFTFVDRIFNTGGSALGLARYKPKDEEFNTDFFEKHNVRLLVTVGGDDTASTANRIGKYLRANDLNVRNIHVPKTIDNDLPLPDRLPTFGFQSARNEAVKICNTIYEDARSSGNWFVVSTMGREAGHLAWAIGTSCHYPMIIIPEMFIDNGKRNGRNVSFENIINIIISSMIKRQIMGIDHGVVAVSEGVFHFMDDEEIIKSGIKFTFDEHGHPELGTVSKAHIFNVLLQQKLKKLGIKIKSRPVEIGYEIRCVEPTAFDLDYCTRLGTGVKQLYDDGHTGCIVVAKGDGTIEPLYMDTIQGEDGRIVTRLVDVTNEEFEQVYKTLHFIKPKDYPAARTYVEDPETYNVNEITGIEEVWE